MQQNVLIWAFAIISFQYFEVNVEWIMFSPRWNKLQSGKYDTGKVWKFQYGIF